MHSCVTFSLFSDPFEWGGCAQLPQLSGERVGKTLLNTTFTSIWRDRKHDKTCHPACTMRRVTPYELRLLLCMCVCVRVYERGRQRKKIEYFLHEIFTWSDGDDWNNHKQEIFKVHLHTLLDPDPWESSVIEVTSRFKKRKGTNLQTETQLEYFKRVKKKTTTKKTPKNFDITHSNLSQLRGQQQQQRQHRSRGAT